MRYQNYKNQHTEMEYLNNIRKNRTLKVRKSLSKLVNDVKELIDRELKGRETNI